jgi:aminoglycoside phosphotransferase (APT) family kinase protein
MDSLTKRRMSEDELDAVVREGFGAAAQMTAWAELPEGTYNAAYTVTLTDPDLELVLKVAPDPRVELLTYEVDLMRTEAEFYRSAGAVGVPVPEVVLSDFTRRLVETDYIFLARLPGTPLNTVGHEMSGGELAGIRRELAGITARLHTVTGAAFGYPLRRSRSWQPAWRGAFGAMIDDLLADAVRLRSELPASPAYISALVHAHDDVLDEVESPVLVHFDLWDGNVFVDNRPTGDWRITGLIDGERTFFGDPVAELVSLALYRDVDEVPELLAGYADASAQAPDWLSVASGASALTDSGRRRFLLYSAYLYLIMAVEGVTRGFVAPEHDASRARAVERLDVQLERLGRRHV